jgi:hypothetical protein
MCDEYYDARMKAFWRAIAEEDVERKEELDREVDAEVELPKPVLLPTVEPHKAKPAARVR